MTRPVRVAVQIQPGGTPDYARGATPSWPLTTSAST